MTFLGAVGTVTGSKYLVETPKSRILVDCGLFQGVAELRQRNWKPLPLDARAIDAVVVTHAHLDHTGYLPALVRQGFRGPIHATEDTAALAEIVLKDSAHLMEEDAEHANKHGYSKHHPALPLYTTGDALRTVARFRPAGYDEPIQVAADAAVRFHTAGHILGSSWVNLELGGGPAPRRLVVSGDLGRPGHPLFRPADPYDEADAVLVESTYGNRRHDVAASRERFAEVIRRTTARGGSVLIPAFAVDRTEVVLYELTRMMRDGEIPRLPVHVDSPMALAALDVYRKALTSRSAQLSRDLLTRHDDPFDTGTLAAVHTAEESVRLNNPTVPSIIISASGMATGGRVLHHLEQMLPNPRHTVVLVGFAAVGTRARSLLDGARNLKMFGRYIPVRSEVVDLPAFSAHADADQLIDWLRAGRQPDTVYVVHGEPRASAELRDRIEQDLGWNAVVPKYAEKVRV
ncbi:MAG TPA: MBL fold metallo-hydrolase [Actinospica sp.]|nr:MBL fold metallo-hydrolase [Actinospica sp.]